MENKTQSSISYDQFMPGPFEKRTDRLLDGNLFLVFPDAVQVA
jgi:hypothetical protein